VVNGYRSSEAPHIDKEEKEEERFSCQNENLLGKEDNKEEEKKGKEEAGTVNELDRHKAVASLAGCCFSPLLRCNPWSKGGVDLP